MLYHSSRRGVERSVYTDELEESVVPARNYEGMPFCPPATVFNVGLPRTGTTSISRYLADLGFTSYHEFWPSPPSFQDVESCYHMNGTCGFYGKMGAGDPTTRIGFEDVPTFGLACGLAKAYPTSKFILMTRSPDSYLASVHYMLCKWVRPVCAKLTKSDHLRSQTLLYGESFPNFCHLLQRQPELCKRDKQADLLSPYRLSTSADLLSPIAKQAWEVTGLMKQFADAQIHHDEQVVKCVPEESILSLELGALDNDDRIFKFLGCNGVVPPFPHANKRVTS